eukprot:8671519-Ditylum_brightwellii.AAC.1
MAKSPKSDTRFTKSSQLKKMLYCKASQVGQGQGFSLLAVGANHMPAGAYGPTYGVDFLNSRAANIGQGIAIAPCRGNVAQIKAYLGK